MAPHERVGPSSDRIVQETVFFDIFPELKESVDTPNTYEGIVEPQLQAYMQRFGRVMATLTLPPQINQLGARRFLEAFSVLGKVVLKNL